MRVSGSAERGRPLSRLGLVALAHAVILAAVYYVTVHTVAGRLLSDASLRGALSTGSLVGTVDAVLNVVSIASLLGAVAAVALIALVRLARVQGLAATGVLVTANLSALLLKDYVLPRPDLGLHEIAPATLNSLPSGHSTAAFSAVAALLFVVPRRWRLALVTVGGPYAAVTGVATMLAGWHRAADSIAAFLLVGFWTTVAAAATVVVLAAAPAERSTVLDALPASSVRWIAATSLGCLSIGAPLAVALSGSAPVRDSTIGSWVAFLAAGLMITGTVLGVLVAILRVLDLGGWANDHRHGAGRPGRDPAGARHSRLRRLGRCSCLSTLEPWQSRQPRRYHGDGAVATEWLRALRSRRWIEVAAESQKHGGDHGEGMPCEHRIAQIR